ncbi:hypothetical protein FN846DRAFT_924599 [Sphaerosporella brunnea]|uniref:Uncharacterized protein n=1 Tax=Sphaerosporella brunnea TaxID=1250544 RepID=A0A5J5FCD1_9PEZI|nr:hypothetical protein FN846DRAFT_924599 [Sphaerosporella brunnea]
MQTHAHPQHQRGPQPGTEVDSWIEIPSSPDESDADAEIITCGLRIRRPAARRPAPTRNLAETVFLENPMVLSIESVNSGGSSSSSEEEEEEEAGEAEEEKEEEEEDVAGYLADMPLSSSGFTTSSESSDEDADDEGETVFESPPSLLTHKARLEQEHDAALRASLSTLLSCAAAAGRARRPPVEGLRVVQSVSPPASSEGSTGRKKKREKERERERREKVVNRTLVTLAVTAGAVVVLSVLSFSAGYLMRRFEAPAVVEEARRVRVRVA